MSLAEQFAEYEAELGLKLTDEQKESMKEFMLYDDDIEDISNEEFQKALTNLENLIK